MDRPRVAVVTGATSGLGRDTAQAISRTPGWGVVLAVRDPTRGDELARQLGGDAGVVPLDLAALASVRAAAAALAERHAPVSALVLNAGLQVTRASRASQDGYELTFAVNHLGQFLLTELLRPHLTPDARIAVVSSGTHWGTWAKSGPFPRPGWDDPRKLAQPRDASGQEAYATSKLANVYFAYEAARRYPGIAVNAFDPGLMPATGLARDYPALVRALNRALAPLVSRLPFAARPEESAAALARLVTDPDLASLTGRYVERGHEELSSPASYDRERARQLWEASVELVQASGPVGRRNP